MLKALEYLDEQSQQLETTLSVVEAEVVQRRAIVSTLRDEQATIEAAEVIRSADTEVANKLEQLLKVEQGEI